MGTTNDNSFTGLFVILLIFYVAIASLYIWATVRIIRRSGYSGWWVLIGLVPLVNIVMFFIFAFKKSPAELELEQLRAWARQAQQPPQYPPQQYPPPY